MSGRIRQLKPDFHLDEEFWALMSAHPDMFLDRAFEGLWCHSDREGRFEWRPQMLKAKILPYWAGDFSLVLEMLAEAGYVVSYEVEGRRYGWVRSFSKHQRPNSREPSSVLPPPPPHADTRTRVHAHADESPRASLPPHPTPNTQHPNPTRSSGVAELPEVPGLTLVAAPPEPPEPHPGSLKPSKRDQADAVPPSGPPGLRYRFRPDWDPSPAHRARGHEYGLTDEEMLQRAEDCRLKPIKHGFQDEDEHFFRELLWMKRDREKRVFKTQGEREAFELPGRERRAR